MEMGELTRFALVTFTSLLFLVDPIAVVPTFLVMTASDSHERRRSMARRACIAAAAILLVFAIGGRFIFQAFGITLPAFRVAGGAILWVVAMDMLHGSRTTQEGEPELSEGQEKEDVAITPLAVPMLAGPGAISTAMVLAGQAHSLVQSLIVYAAIVLTLAIAWVMLSLGDRLLAYLGRTGIRVVMRIMGLLLAALAAEFILSGVRDSLWPAGDTARAQPVAVATAHTGVRARISHVLGG
jgi:multiple antibiotic resistance protein